jgi:hypothetical protein
MYTHFNSSFYRSKRPENQLTYFKRPIVYKWVLNGKNLDDVCNFIVPYLHIKKQQCEIMIKFRNTYNNDLVKTMSNKEKKEHAASVYQERINYMNELKLLNKANYKEQPCSE